MIAFVCPHCGQRLEADTSGAGASVQCPTCAKPLTVPTPWTGEIEDNINPSERSTRRRLLPLTVGLAVAFIVGILVFWKVMDRPKDTLDPVSSKPSSAPGKVSTLLNRASARLRSEAIGGKNVQIESWATRQPPWSVGSKTVALAQAGTASSSIVEVRVNLRPDILNPRLMSTAEIQEFQKDQHRAPVRLEDIVLRFHFRPHDTMRSFEITLEDTTPINLPFQSGRFVTVMEQKVVPSDSSSNVRDRRSVYDLRLDDFRLLGPNSSLTTAEALEYRGGIGRDVQVFSATGFQGHVNALFVISQRSPFGKPWRFQYKNEPAIELTQSLCRQPSATVKPSRSIAAKFKPSV